MTVNISWGFDGDQGYNLLKDPVDFFEAQDVAEQCGLAIGREWVDKAVLASRYLLIP